MAEAPLPPAFYATSGDRARWRDWWALLHPPYTAWHLGYVVIGACLAPDLDHVRLMATAAAFFLAVGIAAHALDEVRGRPLRTRLPERVLISAAGLSLAGAVALGIAGIPRVGAGLIVFIVTGAALVLAYNLELGGGRIHTDVGFAAAWGAFPVLTAYYAQAETLHLSAVVAAGGAFALSVAQRALSTPARQLRRRTERAEARLVDRDGSVRTLDTAELLRPLEVALRALACGVVALAVALLLAHSIGRS